MVRSGREARCAQLVPHQVRTGEADALIVERSTLPQEEEENGYGRLDNRPVRSCVRRQPPPLIDILGPKFYATGQVCSAAEGDLPREEILDNFGDSQAAEVTAEVDHRAGGELCIPSMYGGLKRLSSDSEPHTPWRTSERPAVTIAIRRRHRRDELIRCVDVPPATFLESQRRWELFEPRLACSNDRFRPTKDASVMGNQVGDCPSGAMSNRGLGRSAEYGRRGLNVADN